MSAYHRTRAERTMTATIALTEPTAAEDLVLDEDTGEYVDPAVAYAIVPCRVTALATIGDHLADAGETVHTVVGYQVAVPLTVDSIEVGHVGLLTNTGDDILDGRKLRVDEILMGSLLVERRLRCSITD